MSNAFGEASHAEAGTDPVDLHEVAYLRGGSRELLKLRLFELMQKGCLIVIDEKRWYGTNRWLAVATDLQNRETLPPADQRLLELFQHRRTSKDVFNLNFPQELEDACKRYREELMQRQMLTGSRAPEDRDEPWRTAVAVAAFLAAFGLAGYASHVMQSGLPMFLFFAGFFVYGRLFPDDRYRLSDSGEQYLREIQRQFQFLTIFRNAGQVGPAEELKAVAIFGLGILTNSRFDALAETLKGKTSQGSGDYGYANAGGCDGSADSSCG